MSQFALQTITQAIEQLGYNYYLCAPTGKAAKRINEIIGREAKTIHRLIGYDPISSRRWDEDNPLEPGYFLVDEGSMIELKFDV